MAKTQGVKNSKSILENVLQCNTTLCFFTVCGLWSQEAIPETLKPAPEKNVILDIQSIIIHPDFVPGQVHC
jgi:hypothetical protein